MKDAKDAVTGLLDVEAPIMLRFTSTLNDYSVALYRDLLGDLVLMQSWGGKFTGRGGGETRYVESFAAGEERLQKIRKTRERYGYTQLQQLKPA